MLCLAMWSVCIQGQYEACERSAHALTIPLLPLAAERLGWASWRLQGLGVCQPKAIAGRECLGVLQRSYPLFKTGAMIPEIIGKGRIALDRLPIAGTFFSLERMAKLFHPSSSRWLSLAPSHTGKNPGRGSCAVKHPPQADRLWLLAGADPVLEDVEPQAFRLLPLLRRRGSKPRG